MELVPADEWNDLIDVDCSEAWDILLEDQNVVEQLRDHLEICLDYSIPDYDDPLHWRKFSEQARKID